VLGTSAVPAAAASPPPSAPDPAVGSQAVAYQVGVTHDGHSGDITIAPPLHRRWVRTLSGPISYPLIAAGKVFGTAVRRSAGPPGTTLDALNQVTGATVWSQRIGGPFAWSNAAYDAGLVFVVSAGGLLTAYEAASGAPAWSEQLPGQYLFSSPPTADGGM